MTPVFSCFLNIFTGFFFILLNLRIVAQDRSQALVSEIATIVGAPAAAGGATTAAMV